MRASVLANPAQAPPAGVPEKDGKP
jgi:hypothetical protein